ncbi:MAG: hypothetical protein ACD_76C00094G0030 [uncultured bacterium]|nr:MAG: hypothetical protein ACD_76C00094G0030 [uncultured bacterium]HBD05285.1 Holliday junction resolvase RuvX [Candidatus Uhrbacteria bacterium]
MRFLGIDYGDKKIGLSIGDDETKIAVPFGVIQNNKDIVKFILEIISTEDVGAIVVGVPLKTGSHHGPKQLEKSRRFIEKLKRSVSVQIFEQDESYTTAEGKRLMMEDGVTAKEDELAAMIILQDYLSS